MKMYKSPFQHAYLLNGFFPGSQRTHACLRYGIWCWSNAVSNPKMAISYLMRKMSKLLDKG